MSSDSGTSVSAVELGEVRRSITLAHRLAAELEVKLSTIRQEVERSLAKAD